MRVDELEFSDKFLDYVKSNPDGEVLEGETAAGKTIVGMCFKFITKVMRSDKKLHLLSSSTNGTAEQNMINAEMGILEQWGDLIEYKSDGDKNFKFPHLKVYARGAIKYVRVVAYSDKSKWKQALGAKYGCVGIDEMNIADPDFINEAIMRADDYWIGTLNPDDPDKKVYKTHINKCRPVDKYIDSVPTEIQKELNKELEHNNWDYWFFRMDDNKALTEEYKNKRRSSVPVGTQLYKSKILGLRGKAEGLIWETLNWNNIVKTPQFFKQFKFKQFSIGVDTSFSDNTEDTITFMGEGITECGRLCILKERVYNNKVLSDANKITPSMIPKLLVEYHKELEKAWGYSQLAFIDNADSGTMQECLKYKRNVQCNVTFTQSNKKSKIAKDKTARVDVVTGWLGTGHYLISTECPKHQQEMRGYCWKEGTKRTPVDGKDHTIDGVSYAWLPYDYMIGVNT